MLTYLSTFAALRTIRERLVEIYRRLSTIHASDGPTNYCRPGTEYQAPRNISMLFSGIDRIHVTKMFHNANTNLVKQRSCQLLFCSEAHQSERLSSDARAFSLEPGFFQYYIGTVPNR